MQSATTSSPEKMTIKSCLINRASGIANNSPEVRRRNLLFRSETKPGTRKRRQQEAETSNTLPEKSRRCDVTDNVVISGKNRSLGGFFTNLALKIRNSVSESPANQKLLPIARPNSPLCEITQNVNWERSAREKLGNGFQQRPNRPKGPLNVKISKTPVLQEVVEITEIAVKKNSSDSTKTCDVDSSENERPKVSNVHKDPNLRLRKSIQWLEDGSRQLREELAQTRSQLHEERRAAKVMRCNLEAIIRDAKSSEAAKYQQIIAELKTRLLRAPSRATLSVSPSPSKTDHLKEENHRREVSSLKNRLKDAEQTIQKLKSNSLDALRGRRGKQSQTTESGTVGINVEARKLEAEVQTLRNVNKKLEDKLQIAEESLRLRTTELRAQHERHEAELSALQKALRSDTVRMILNVIILVIYGTGGEQRFLGVGGTWNLNEHKNTSVEIISSGIFVGYLIYNAVTLLSYSFGNLNMRKSLVEFLMNFIAMVMFISIGAVALHYWIGYVDNRAIAKISSQRRNGVALGILCEILGVAYLVDLVLMFSQVMRLESRLQYFNPPNL